MKELAKSSTRFMAALALSLPSLFAGCEKETPPPPQDQEIKGTATKVIFFSQSSTHSLRGIEVQFKDEDGRNCNLALIHSNKISEAKAYEGDVIVSTENFIRPETRIIEKGDVYVGTTNNQEYKINVNVLPEAELHVSHDNDGSGYKSFEILVPSNAISNINYGLFSNVEILEVYSNRDKMNEAVERFLDNIKNSPYLPREEGMGFAVDLIIR